MKIEREEIAQEITLVELERSALAAGRLTYSDGSKIPGARSKVSAEKYASSRIRRFACGHGITGSGGKRGGANRPMPTRVSMPAARETAAQDWGAVLLLTEGLCELDRAIAIALAAGHNYRDISAQVKIGLRQVCERVATIRKQLSGNR